MDTKTDCYKCEFQHPIPGNCHIQCVKPDPEMQGSPHGMRNGWFFYPLNFDPIWKTKECSNFQDKDITPLTKG